MSGFLYLDKRRQFVSAGMSAFPQYVSMEAVESYCRLMNYRGPRVRDFMYYVEVLDDESVAIKRARIAQQTRPTDDDENVN